MTFWQKYRQNSVAPGGRNGKNPVVRPTGEIPKNSLFSPFKCRIFGKTGRDEPVSNRSTQCLLCFLPPLMKGAHLYAYFPIPLGVPFFKHPLRVFFASVDGPNWRIFGSGPNRKGNLSKAILMPSPHIDHLVCSRPE